MALELLRNEIKYIVRLYRQLGLTHEATELENRLMFLNPPWRGEEPDGLFNDIPCRVLEVDPFYVKLFLATGDIIDVPYNVFKSRFKPLK